MRWLIAPLIVILVACDRAPEPTFHLLRSVNGTAQVADFAELNADQDGLRRFTLISIRRDAYRGPTGDAVQFTRTFYAFDCAGRRYRGEGLVAYGPDFSLVEELKGLSEWAPITDYRGLAGDYSMVCSDDHSAASFLRLDGSDWTDAAKAALERLELEAGT